jgi:hypothetical protein
MGEGGKSHLDSGVSSRKHKQTARRNRPVENMWMIGGKLVDILTRRENYFAQWTQIAPVAACGCAFVTPFACAARSGG